MKKKCNTWHDSWCIKNTSSRNISAVKSQMLMVQWNASGESWTVFMNGIGGKFSTSKMDRYPSQDMPGWSFLTALLGTPFQSHACAGITTLTKKVGADTRVTRIFWLCLQAAFFTAASSAFFRACKREQARFLLKKHLKKKPMQRTWCLEILEAKKRNKNLQLFKPPAPSSPIGNKIPCTIAPVPQTQATQFLCPDKPDASWCFLANFMKFQTLSTLSPFIKQPSLTTIFLFCGVHSRVPVCPSVQHGRSTAVDPVWVGDGLVLQYVVGQFR